MAGSVAIVPVKLMTLLKESHKEIKLKNADPFNKLMTLFKSHISLSIYALIFLN